MFRGRFNSIRNTPKTIPINPSFVAYPAENWLNLIVKEAWEAPILNIMPGTLIVNLATSLGAIIRVTRHMKLRMLGLGKGINMTAIYYALQEIKKSHKLVRKETIIPARRVDSGFVYTVDMWLSVTILIL